MIAALVIGVPALILINAFFVGAEYALVRSRIDRIAALQEEGAQGAALAKRQIDHIDEYIAACQVGITLASISKDVQQLIQTVFKDKVLPSEQARRQAAAAAQTDGAATT